MSDEPENLIQSIFVEKCGAKYPIVKSGGKVASQYGIKFYPSVFCIAPDGKVHSVPDDRMPSEETIEQLLKDVSLAPKLPDDSRYAPVRSMWEKKQYDKLGAWLDKMLAEEKLDGDMRQVLQGQRDELTKRADKQVERVASLAQGPDYLAATDKLEAIAKQWAGFPAADKAKEELARFKADATVKKEVLASKALAKIVDKFDPSSQSQQKKLIEALEKFAKKNEGTYAAKQAAEQVGKLKGG